MVAMNRISDLILIYTPSGTTNSAVAIMEAKTPKIIENAEGMCKIFSRAGPGYFDKRR